MNTHKEEHVKDEANAGQKELQQVLSNFMHKLRILEIHAVVLTEKLYNVRQRYAALQENDYILLIQEYNQNYVHMQLERLFIQICIVKEEKQVMAKKLQELAQCRDINIVRTELSDMEKKFQELMRQMLKFGVHVTFV